MTGALATLLASWSLCISSAWAHGAPAVPPDLPADGCVRIVDLDTETSVHFAYSVAEDDVEPDLEDIPLPDTKSHQFFALEGAVAPNGAAYLFFPSSGEPSDGANMPIWISVDDVKRAAEANGNAGSTTTTFSESDVPEDATLEGHSVVGSRFVRITADDARVPITMEQAALGFDWDVTGVAPGVYTVAGYIFSPPTNGWVGSETLVKLRAGDADFPAATLDSVDALVFGYQGLPLSGCVDAPDGSRLSLYYQVLERPEDGWLGVIDDAPVDGAAFAHCFVAPEGTSGSARFRLDVEAPDGTVFRAYSPDTATLLSGTGECVASDEVCCDGVPAAASTPDAGPADATADVAPPGDGDASDAASEPAEAPTPEGDDDSGCRAAAGKRPDWASLAALAGLLLALRRRR